jgi:ketosteroid isomerase-like protein
VDRIDVVRNLLRGQSEGVREGDLGRLFDLAVDTGLVHPEFELIPARELAAPETIYRGRTGFLEFTLMWTEDFEDWSTELAEAADASGDRVAAVVRQRGTGKGSGVPTELRHGALYEFVGERLRRVRLYVDPDEPFEVAGLRSRHGRAGGGG